MDSRARLKPYSTSWLMAYYLALQQCGERYRAMATQVGDEPFRNFVYEFESGIGLRKPLLKLCRWLGYIQGVLIERGVTTVEAERDWTRPLFRPLDFQEEV